MLGKIKNNINGQIFEAPALNQLRTLIFLLLLKSQNLSKASADLK